MADLVDLLPIAQIEADAWVERVLLVVPPTRGRAPVRLELQTRQAKVADRLKEVVAEVSSQDRQALGSRADKALNGLNAALTAPTLLSDTVGPTKFLAAVRLADAALARVTDLAAEALKLADVAEDRRETRMRLNTAFVRQQETMRTQSGRALGGGGPGQDELVARDAENAMRDAIESNGFTSNLATEAEFAQAAQAAETALTTWKGASGGLKDRGDTGDIQAAAQAIAVERQALALALTHKAFAGPAKALDKTLDEAAQVLHAATGNKIAAAQTATKAAIDGAAARLRIEAAIGVFDPLLLTVAEAAKAADPTPRATLQKAFQEAAKTAVVVIHTGDPTAALRAVEPLLHSTVELTQEAKLLRERGVALDQAFGLAKAGLSADQLSAIGDVAALTEKLKDVTAETVTALPGELDKAEQALATAQEARETYRLLDETLRQMATGFGGSKALGIDGRALFIAALDAAELKRRSTHEAGQTQLAGLETAAAAFGSFSTTIAGFDAPLATKGVRERLAEPLGKLDAPAALAAPATVPALRDAAANLTNPLLAWAAFCAVNLDEAPLKQVKEAEPIYRQKLQAAETEATNGNVQAAGQAAAALKEWLAAVAQFAKGEKPRLDALAVIGDAAITTMLSKAVGVYDKAKQEIDFGKAGLQLSLLAALVKPATDLESARDDAAKVFERIEGTGPEAKRPENKNKDTEFKKTLTDALTGLTAETKLLGERRVTLVDLLNQMKQAETTRQKAVKQDIGSKPMTAQKATAIFNDPAAAPLAMQIYTWLGKAPMQAMLAVIGDGSGGMPALVKVVKELAALGKKKLAMLKTQLGDPGHLGKLCSPDGSVSFLEDLAETFDGEEAKLGGLMQTGASGNVDRFKAMLDGDADRAKEIADKFDMAKLGTLLATGFSGDNATIKGVFDNGTVDQVKALSDKFTQRTLLQRMTNAMGGGAAGEKIKTIADTNFGGDWEKMKVPFFDNLKSAPDGNRLMRVADQFTKDQTAAPGLGNIGGFDSVDVGHVHKRHTPERFDFSKIKTSNTQFTKAQRQDLTGLLEAAVLAVDGWYRWQPGNVWPVSDDGAYKTFDVTAKGSNLRVGVDYWQANDGSWRYHVAQIYPQGGDEFSEVQMTKLKLALNR